MNKKLNITRDFLLFLTIISFFSCRKDNFKKREFSSSFETVEDFAGFYITPQGYKGTSFHELSDSVVHSGTFSHKAWITGANPPSTSFVNNNHRGYPTVQFQNTPEGPFETPCYVTLWVWLDTELKPDSLGGEDDWFSFATFTDDKSDNWARTVLVNLNYDGFVHLQNVPKQGQQEHLFQTDNLRFPQREWVELTIYLDFRNGGYAKVWQNGELVSYAKVKNIKNRIAQAHFGLYCPPQMTTGVIYNDDLTIRTVERE